MTSEDPKAGLTDWADEPLSGSDWETWQAANPEAAAEVIIAQRVRLLVSELRAASIAVPDQFEARLMARIRDDRTVLELLNVSLSGGGQVIRELINALLSFFPPAQVVPAT